MKKAILFDLDGVIVNTAVYHYRAWKRLADEEGIYFDRQINERLKGVSRRKSLDIILERSEKEYSEFEKEKMCERKNKWYADSVAELERDEILPGIMEFLCWLKERDYLTALCSASRNAGKIIYALELEPYFDCIVDAATLKKQKPDPEIFVRAAQKFGKENNECVVVEDSFAGIHAAVSAGMHTIGIGDAETLKEAELIVSDTAGENFEIIKKWLQK